jgi:hypothetical protein
MQVQRGLLRLALIVVSGAISALIFGVLIWGEQVFGTPIAGAAPSARLRVFSDISSERVIRNRSVGDRAQWHAASESCGLQTFFTESIKKFPAKFAVAANQADQPIQQVETAWIGGAYFSALGVQAVRGRVLMPGERSAAVISQTLAERVFGSAQAALGRDMEIIGYLSSIRKSFKVVGIVNAEFQGTGLTGNAQAWVDDQNSPDLVLPSEQIDMLAMVLPPSVLAVLPPELSESVAVSCLNAFAVNGNWWHGADSRIVAFTGLGRSTDERQLAMRAWPIYAGLLSALFVVLSLLLLVDRLLDIRRNTQSDQLRRFYGESAPQRFARLLLRHGTLIALPFLLALAFAAPVARNLSAFELSALAKTALLPSAPSLALLGVFFVSLVGASVLANTVASRGAQSTLRASSASTMLWLFAFLALSGISISVALALGLKLELMKLRTLNLPPNASNISVFFLAPKTSDVMQIAFDTQRADDFLLGVKALAGALNCNVTVAHSGPLYRPEIEEIQFGNETQAIPTSVNYVDANYFDFFGITVLSGSNTNSNAALVNLRLQSARLQNQEVRGMRYRLGGISGFNDTGEKHIQGLVQNAHRWSVLGSFVAMMYRPIHLQKHVRYVFVRSVTPEFERGLSLLAEQHLPNYSLSKIGSYRDWLDRGLGVEIARANTLGAVASALVLSAFFALWFLLRAILQPMQRKLAIMRALGASNIHILRGCFPKSSLTLIGTLSFMAWLTFTALAAFALVKQSSDALATIEIIGCVVAALGTSGAVLILGLLASVHAIRETELLRLIGAES